MTTNGIDGLVVGTARVDEVGVAELLQRAVGDGSADRLDSALSRYASGLGSLVAARTDGRIVGVAGYEPKGDEVRLVHIATDPSYEKRGVGSALITWIVENKGNCSIFAETDGDAVGFYRAVGFSVQSIGEKYPGVERFDVRKVVGT